MAEDATVLQVTIRLFLVGASSLLGTGERKHHLVWAKQGSR